MKLHSVFAVALLVFLHILPSSTFAQWNSITHTTGMQNVAGIDVTTTSVNGTTGGGCDGLYWIQNSGDSYTFSFSVPIAAIQISVDALNTDESVEFLINGAMFPIANCNLDPNPLLGQCSPENCNIVNGQFVNTTTSWICGGKLTFYGPISSFTIREPIGGSGATFNLSFASVGTNVGGCVFVTSVNNMFTTYVNETCTGVTLASSMPSYTPGMSIETFFGDGTTQISNLAQGNNNSAYTYFEHDYAASGTYILKQVLNDGSQAVDSLDLNHDYLFCSNIPVQFYQDLNSNCVFDVNSDSQPTYPVEVEVRHNSIPVDTISTMAGLYYLAYGNPGDIYTFQILSLPGGMVPTCPVSGSLDLTLQPLVYYTTPNYMGIGCTTSNFDLAVDASLQTAANMANVDINIDNFGCVPQNGVLTMNFSPKYIFGYSSIQPTFQSGNTATWNLNGLSTFTGQNEYIHVHLVPNGNVLTPGDTVHTEISITPTVGDVNPANNMIVQDDTVTGPYDPNAIFVNPSSCVQPGTKLEYVVTFENLGNDTAHSVYVMDTLNTAGFDFSTFKFISASHQMNVTELVNGAITVFKFEFPNINLPGANSQQRHGMVKYTIEMKDNFPIGSSVTNKAGIYFDYMPAVLTNVATTGACWPASVNEVSSANNTIRIYPNPATEELTIKTQQSYISYTITNSIGQMMMTKDMSGKESKVNIKSLSTGVYYISLKGQGGTEVRKFVKL